MQVAELFAKLGLKVDKKSWSVGNDVIAGLGKALAVWAGVKVVQGLAGVVDEVQELGGRLDDLAQQTGVSAEGLQELGFAAKLSGSDMDTAVAGARVFAKQLNVAAETGKGPLVDGLNAIGVSLTSVRKKLTEQGFLGALGLVADKFSDMPDGPKKSALAMEIFGKAGAELIPLLNNGSAGIEALAKRAHELGVVMSNDDVKKLADFGDTLDEVKLSWQGIKQQAVIALLPVLKEMVDGLLKWITANREIVRSKLTAFIGALASAVRVLGKVIAFVVEHWEFFAAALAGAAVVTGIIRLIKFMEWLQLASTAAAAKTLVAWTVAAAPFILIGAAIAALVLLVTKYRKTAREVFNWIVGRMVAIVEWITSLPGRAIGALVALGNLIKTKIGEAWDWVKQKAEDTWNFITSIPGRVKNFALDKLGLGPSPSERANAMRAQPIQPGSAGYITPRGSSKPVVQITNGPMTVTVPPGGNPADYEAAVRKGVQEEWANQMNHALADAGEE